MFEIYTSNAPYADQTYASVRRFFQEKKFPLAEIECPVIRQVIEKCWRDEYVEVSDIFMDLLAACGAQQLSEQDTSHLPR